MNYSNFTEWKELWEKEHGVKMSQDEESRYHDGWKAASSLSFPQVDYVFDKGDKYFDEEAALSILLREGVLFSNGRKYLEDNHKEGEPDEISGPTVILFVICNDTFGWACAAAECLPYEEIENLYRMWQQDKMWGSTKWCCIHAGLKPMAPVEESLRIAGLWDEQMDKLKPNHWPYVPTEPYQYNLPGETDDQRRLRVSGSKI